MSLPEDWDVKQVVVNDQLDAADDWIVEQLKANDVVVTDDIPLAHRANKAGARVIQHKGRILSDENIGNIVATRDLLHSLRGAGEITGGPAPFQKEDRSRFLQSLEQLLQDIKKI